MTKAGLSDAVYRVHGGFSRREATRVVDHLLDGMRRALRRDGQVRIAGFGRLEVIRRRGRRGRDPQTGRSIRIPERSTVVLRPSPRLLDRLAGGEE